MVAVLYACCSKWQLFLPFEFTIDDKSPEDCWSTPISWGWTIWISHGSGWNDYAFVKGEPSLLVIYGMFYGEKWTPTEAIVPSTHPLKRHDTWNLLVFFSGFLYWPSLFEPFPRWTKFELPNVWRVHPCCLPPNFVVSGLPLMLLLAAACWISHFWW